jgi:hypothetical protein
MKPTKTGHNMHVQYRIQQGRFQGPSQNSHNYITNILTFNNSIMDEREITEYKKRKTKYNI